MLDLIFKYLWHLTALYFLIKLENNFVLYLIGGSLNLHDEIKGMIGYWKGMGLFLVIEGFIILAGFLAIVGVASDLGLLISKGA